MQLGKKEVYSPLEFLEVLFQLQIPTSALTTLYTKVLFEGLMYHERQLF